MAEANNDIGYGDGDDDSHNHHQCGNSYKISKFIWNNKREASQLTSVRNLESRSRSMAHIPASLKQDQEKRGGEP